MRTVHHTLGEETYEEQTDARRFNPGVVCCFRDRTGRHRVMIGTGDSDYVDVYREGSVTFVLSRHYGLGYVGLQAYEGEDRIGEIFLQSTENVDDLLGEGGIDKSGWWIAKALADYVLNQY